jgi:hypothetical protein
VDPLDPVETWVLPEYRAFLVHQGSWDRLVPGVVVHRDSKEIPAQKDLKVIWGHRGISVKVFSVSRVNVVLVVQMVSVDHRES